MGKNIPGDFSGRERALGTMNVFSISNKIALSAFVIDQPHLGYSQRRRATGRADLNSLNKDYM